MYGEKHACTHTHTHTQVYSQMKSTVDQLSWVERLYPSNIASKMAGGFESLSDWLKSSREKDHAATVGSAGGSSSDSTTGIRTRYVVL